MTQDWKTFTLRIPINASPKAIYDAWTTQQGLESWFLRAALFTSKDGAARSKNSRIETGDHYRWHWHGYDDSVFEEKEILAVNGWDELQFGFSGDCVVTVSIKQEEGETICQLCQEMHSPDEATRKNHWLGDSGGWNFYLVNLKSVLEGGLDLRNRNTKLQKLINA